LRVYFLEQKNPNVPDDVESLMQQMIDLKVQNESLYKDLQEKQELLCQASKALELMEEAKNDDESHVEKVIESLKEKVSSLENENQNLQQALNEVNNKTNLANDTGFTEFLGAVEAKDADIHRKMVEITQHSEELQCKINDMTILMKEYEVDNKKLNDKVAKLQYEKDEMKDKLQGMQSSSNEMVRRIFNFN
jgi:centrosomin